MVDAVLECCLIFVSLFYLCNELKNSICLFLYSLGFIPTHTPYTRGFQLTKECEAFVCGSAQTLVYKCIHPVWVYERYRCHMEITSDTYSLGQMGEKSVPLTCTMERTFPENCCLLWLYNSLIHQSTDASLLSERIQRERWDFTVAQKENWSPSASSPHPDLQTGWTQPKEAAALRPPTDWQLHIGIPMTARKELAAILPPRAPSLQGTINTSPSKNWIARYFIQPNDS